MPQNGPPPPTVNEGVWPGKKRFQSLALCGLAWTPFALSPLGPKPKGRVKNVSNALADIRSYRPLRFCSLEHTTGVIKGNV